MTGTDSFVHMHQAAPVLEVCIEDTTGLCQLHCVERACANNNVCVSAEEASKDALVVFYMA